MIRIGILGGGSWGTALAQILAEKQEVLLFVKNEEVEREVNENHTNSEYTGDIELHENLRASCRIEDFSEMEVLVNAIPTQATRTVLNLLKPHLKTKPLIINAAKGIEMKTHNRLSQVVGDVLPQCEYAVLSGPSHAEEVIIQMPTAIVAAAEKEETRCFVQDLFMRNYFRVYTNEDIIGVEIGGSVKNILALGMGIVDGLGFGDNTKAALMTRGMHEMARFGKSLGGSNKTLYGLAGMGDLVVTATSRHSRNRNAGEWIGKGYTKEEAEEIVRMTVEGIATCEAVTEIAREKGIEMPITYEIYDILFKGKDARDTVGNLMLRERKEEFDY